MLMLLIVNLNFFICFDTIWKGVTAAASTYPLDLIRARMAFSVATSGASIQSGVLTITSRPTILNTFVSVVRTEGGIFALYKGNHYYQFTKVSLLIRLSFVCPFRQDWHRLYWPWFLMPAFRSIASNDLSICCWPIFPSFAPNPVRIKKCLVYLPNCCAAGSPVSVQSAPSISRSNWLNFSSMLLYQVPLLKRFRTRWTWLVEECNCQWSTKKRKSTRKDLSRRCVWCTASTELRKDSIAECRLITFARFRWWRSVFRLTSLWSKVWVSILASIRNHFLKIFLIDFRLFQYIQYILRIICSVITIIIIHYAFHFQVLIFKVYKFFLDVFSF